ncbi:hypothetical protein L596_001808 [Steinernema carpocapsae]|uniref:Uncharacterized protein n=1 Tax=Steinernema carpocapsae TaxID=34508 RepID=A0A4U8UR70_STECR|nr:hypothetical protein L596_001808 [Steinernema carpocapsae]
MIVFESISSLWWHLNRTFSTLIPLLFPEQKTGPKRPFGGSPALLHPVAAAAAAKTWLRHRSALLRVVNIFFTSSSLISLIRVIIDRVLCEAVYVALFTSLVLFVPRYESGPICVTSPCVQ